MKPSIFSGVIFTVVYLSFVGWQQCVKSKWLITCLPAKPRALSRHQDSVTISGAGKQAITAEKQWPRSEGSSPDATMKTTGSERPTRGGLPALPPAKLGGLGQISHLLCVSRAAMRSIWVNVQHAGNSVGVLSDCFHLDYNEFLDFLYRYVTHITIPLLL